MVKIVNNMLFRIIIIFHIQIFYISILYLTCSIFINSEKVGVLPIKESTALSEHPLYGPENAVDNDTDTFFASSDNATINAWIQLELKNAGSVRSVQITNREDCCGQRLKNMEVRFGNTSVMKTEQVPISSNTVCGSFGGPGSDGELIVIDCNQTVEGKYVTIQTLDDTVTQINIAEVQVIGNETNAGK